MNEKSNEGNILFLDIETVPQYPVFEKMDKSMQQLWAKKTEYQRKENDTPESFYSRAGIYAEFGKIVCISAAYLHEENNERQFRMKSYFGTDERQILIEFSSLLNNLSDKKESMLCGHNSKEFDIPYIARRMIINGLKLPKIIDVSGKKPWETNFIDTMEMWKFGDYKNYVSLNLLANVLGLPTPKDDIDGSEVGNVYWVEKDLQRIATYCQKDVVTVANVYLRMKGKEIIKENEVIYR